MSRYFLIVYCILFSVLTNAQTQTDASGKKQGYWRKKDDKSNKLIYEGLFKDNKPQGIFKYYYPHDTIKAIMNFKQDGKIAYSTMFHPSGKKMAYGNNRADFTAIPGGVVPGLILLKPDYLENKDDWPFFWGENECIIDGGAWYVFLANAVNELQKELK